MSPLSSQSISCNTSTLRQMIESVAARYSLDSKLIASIVWEESKGDPYAGRFEPDFYSKRLEWRQRKDLAGFVPTNLPTLDTEKVWRATSWGVMQVLGETARVVGFRERYLTTLTDPRKSLEVGCIFLELLFKKAQGAKSDRNTVRKVLEWYNGSPVYDDRVLQHYDKGTFEGLWS